MSAKPAHPKSGKLQASGFKVGDLLASKYRVERLLGEGGMGVVVEAYHELLDQRVAVKLLYQDVADREAQQRLLMEARSAAKLQSDHVARVIDVDVGPDGLPFIVMELLEGGDLCQLVDARGALPRWLVVDYILQALEGLAHAHGRGIVHRDLKPSNLFLANKPDGTQVIKILDFGISKSQDPGDRHAKQLTGGRGVLGSPPYMSPEQVRAPKTVDHRTDIWSLGVCIYELLTNSMPFGGDEIQETFAQILERQPQPITKLVDGIPEGLEAVVFKCLAKNREDRWMDVAELARALAPYGSGTWIQAPDRIQATLARALMEDITSSSGTRLRGPTSTGRISAQQMVATPSNPVMKVPTQRRLDSAELHGTANTVVIGFDRKPKKWVMPFVLATSVVLAVIGIAGIAVYVMQDRIAPVERPTAASDPPAPVDTTVAAEPTAPPAPQPGTLIGASTPQPALVESVTAPGKTPRPAGHGGSRPVVAKPSAAPPSPPPPKTLPAGLPVTRQ